MLDEDHPLALALMHTRILLKRLEQAESFRIIGQHEAANSALGPAFIAHATFKIVKYTTEDREETR